MEDLATDQQGHLQVEALDEAFKRDPSAPTIVLLQAGDINTGAFDQFEAVIPLAHKHGAWVHVDGAFGLWAAASPRYRHLVKGVEAADSWATDGHKWLNVPFDCGYALVAEPDVLGSQRRPTGSAADAPGRRNHRPQRLPGHVKSN